MEFYPPVGQRKRVAGRRGNRGVRADRGRAKAVLLALGGTRAADDVQKGLQPGLTPVSPVWASISSVR